MNRKSSFVPWLMRIYSVMLYAYPRAFRLEYGGEMKQLFRDRCGDLPRAGGLARTLRFARLTTADWMTTTPAERAASLRASLSHARTPTAGNYLIAYAPDKRPLTVASAGSCS